MNKQEGQNIHTKVSFAEFIEIDFFLRRRTDATFVCKTKENTYLYFILNFRNLILEEYFLEAFQKHMLEVFSFRFHELI